MSWQRLPFDMIPETDEVCTGVDIESVVSLSDGEKHRVIERYLVTPPVRLVRGVPHRVAFNPTKGTAVVAIVDPESGAAHRLPEAEE